MSIKVDQTKCIGCQTCAMICPDVFIIEDNGLAKAIKQNTSDKAKEAMTSCPVGAITIE